jgi:hypothetical protein
VIKINTTPKAFISYSHSDKEFVHLMAEDLISSGVDVWIDKWEIQLGDSLIQKIFLEGLENTDFILICLSKNSAKSKWVTEELSVAIVKKIEGLTRLIPIILEPIDVPLPLRGLKWIDMSSNYDEGIRELVKTFHGVSDKPPIGKAPDYVTSLKPSVGGLSQNASTIGSILISRREEDGEDEKRGDEKSYGASELHSLVSFMTIDDFNDAIEELEDDGLIEPLTGMRTRPYTFFNLKPTYGLLLLLKDEGLDYNPEDDIKFVANAIVNKKQTGGKEIKEITKLSPLRINHAVSYLKDRHLVKTIAFAGSAPYDFGIVQSTRHTRMFVNENCR